MRDARLRPAVVGAGREGVVPLAAIERVGAIAARDRIVACAARAKIVARPEQDVIIAAVAEDAVLIVAGVDLVVAAIREINAILLRIGGVFVGEVVAIAVDSVVAATTTELVASEAAPKRVVAIAAVEHVSGASADENVVAVVAAERVHATPADQRVDAVAARKVDGGGDVAIDRDHVVATSEIALDEIDTLEDARGGLVAGAARADHPDAAGSLIAADRERVGTLGGDERDFAARLDGGQIGRGGRSRRRLGRDVEVEQLLVVEDHMTVHDRL